MLTQEGNRNFCVPLWFLSTTLLQKLAAQTLKAWHRQWSILTTTQIQSCAAKPRGWRLCFKNGSRCGTSFPWDAVGKLWESVSPVWSHSWRRMQNVVSYKLRQWAWRKLWWMQTSHKQKRPLPHPKIAGAVCIGYSPCRTTSWTRNPCYSITSRGGAMCACSCQNFTVSLTWLKWFGVTQNIVRLLIILLLIAI